MYIVFFLTLQRYWVCICNKAISIILANEFGKSTGLLAFLIEVVCGLPHFAPEYHDRVLVSVLSVSGLFNDAVSSGFTV
jgi:hypothetical protein